MRELVAQRELGFQLWEVHRLADLAGHGRFADHDRDTLDMMVEAASRLSRAVLAPLRQPMDLDPPVLEDGGVRVHPGTTRALDELGGGGWVGANLAPEHGGGGLPLMVGVACRFLFAAANYSLSVYPMLAAGVSRLIINFAPPELQKLYLPRLLTLEWTGTMALTEPGAGSSLADIATQAEPAGDHYLLSGQKLFISGGEHDARENIVHLLLARIKGAPAGHRGISLFLVPKLRPDGGGLTPNDIVCSGLFHKMGYRGMPLTQLSLGENNDCRGWLVGRENRGLACMFQMMNEARLEVGLAACGVASAAYRASLAYALERRQGRPPGEKDPTQPQARIIRHADVRRLLLKQRAIAEGGLGLVLQAAAYADRAALGGEDAARAGELLDLITPVAKSFPSDLGLEAVSAGLQVLGGYGYCQEYPLELLYREARIHPIHEGTSGIQGMDLLGRKVAGDGGRALALWAEEVRDDIARARRLDAVEPLSQELEAALVGLEQATGRLLALGREHGQEAMLADATLYLELMGLVAVGWQWLKQAQAAQAGLKRAQDAAAVFYKGKLITARFYFSHELPRVRGIVHILGRGPAASLEAEPETFA